MCNRVFVSLVYTCYQLLLLFTAVRWTDLFACKCSAEKGKYSCIQRTIQPFHTTDRR